MRAQRAGGRFTTAYEVNSILHGMTEDLQEEVGMDVNWWVWDPVASEVDPIYDVGSVAIGRRWKSPISVPVIVAQVFQGQTVQNDRGFYNADVLRFTCNMDNVNKALPDLVTNPDAHYLDRVEYRGGVFRPTKLYLRGLVGGVTKVPDDGVYVVLTIDLNQVKAEEMVNDDQFQQYVTSEI
jgi:hypothetical protein